MKPLAFIFIFGFALNIRAAEQIEPPMPPSPIAEFRGWLSQSPEERKVALAKRSEQSRRIIERKLDEYSALPPRERDRRLGATELQWYLTHLLKMPKTRRDLALQQVPVIWQPIVMQRLEEWDKMSPDLQKEALDQRTVVDYLSTPARQQQAIMRSLSQAEQEALNQRIAHWNILPAVERIRIDERLGEFFRLAPSKQQETLNNFTDAERKNMAAALQAFRNLTPAQREQCIKSFAQFTEKFAAMDRTNQIAFLKNAERWQAMSQKERDMWRQVVAVVPPMPELPPEMPQLPTIAPSSAKQPQ